MKESIENPNPIKASMILEKNNENDKCWLDYDYKYQNQTGTHRVMGMCVTYENIMDPIT